MAELEREPAAVQSEAQGQARTGAEEAQARPTMDDMRFTKYDVFPMSRIRDPRVSYTRSEKPAHHAKKNRS